MDLETQGNLKKYLSHASWAIRRIWSANSKLAAGFTFTMALRAVLPAGIVLVSRALINAVVKGIQTGTHDLQQIYTWLAAGFVLTLIFAIADLCSRIYSQLLYNDLNLKITSDILQHASTLDISFFEDPQFQDVIDRAQQNSASHFSQFVTNSVSAAATTLQALLLSVILLRVEPLVIVALFALGVPYLWFRWHLARTHYLKEYSRTTMQRWSRYFVGRLTNHQHVMEVRLFDLAPVLFEKYRGFMQRFIDEDRQLFAKETKGGTVFALTSTAVFYIAFIRVILRAVGGALTVGDVFLYGAVTASLRKTFDNLIVNVSGALEQTLYISNLREFLNLQSRIQDGAEPAAPAFSGAIEFKDVTFTYPSNITPALSDISVCIQKGETVAIVGENGAGKTTLAKLISRMYDPDTGCILLDGIDLRNLSLGTLRNQLSFMPQRFGRYEGTAAENIAYGNWQNLVNHPEKIEECARRVQVHEMILQMPQGYQTLLGRMFGTYDASEGQWQQIALARAFSRNASIFILDEPASHLDARTEYKIFSRVRELAAGHTTILISHRFSTVSMADRIIVLENGRIVEVGAHAELLDRAGLYATLYELQTKQIQREN